MKNRLNICIISQEYPPYTNWGGIGVYNKEFSNAYRESKHDVCVVSRSSKGAPGSEIQENGVKVFRVGSTIFRKHFVGRTIDKILHAKDVFKKVKELDCLKPFDIIETTEAGLEGKELIRRKDFKQRMVIQCNGSNVLGVTPGGILSFVHHLDKRWSFYYEQKILQDVPRIIVTSEATRQFLLKQGVGDSKIELIYQGIDVNHFQPRSAPLESSTLEVGFVGRLERPKGIDFIWKIIEKLGPEAGIRFHFKGNIHWSMKKEVEKNLKRFSKFTTYHPAGDHNEMPKFYQSLHVLLQPSRFENFGLVYAEGMACGLIVFAGKNGGGSEIVKDGITGFIIDPDEDIDYVVNKFKEIASNRKAFTKMTVKARKDVIERFSLKACAKQKISYYNQISTR